MGLVSLLSTHTVGIGPEAARAEWTDSIQMAKSVVCNGTNCGGFETLIFTVDLTSTRWTIEGGRLDITVRVALSGSREDRCFLEYRFGRVIRLDNPTTFAVYWPNSVLPSESTGFLLRLGDTGSYSAAGKRRRAAPGRRVRLPVCRVRRDDDQGRELDEMPAMLVKPVQRFLDGTIARARVERPQLGARGVSGGLSARQN